MHMGPFLDVNSWASATSQYHNIQVFRRNCVYRDIIVTRDPDLLRQEDVYNTQLGILCVFRFC